jgi:hypothetical protein
MLCELSVSAVNILFFRDLRAIRGESFRLLFVLRLNSFLLRELRGESSLPSNGDIIT